MNSGHSAGTATGSTRSGAPRGLGSATGEGTPFPDPIGRVGPSPIGDGYDDSG
jgi:hypothetical protein